MSYFIFLTQQELNPYIILMISHKSKMTPFCFQKLVEFYLKKEKQAFQDKQSHFSNFLFQITLPLTDQFYEQFCQYSKSITTSQLVQIRKNQFLRCRVLYILKCFSVKQPLSQQLTIVQTEMRKGINLQRLDAKYQERYFLERGLLGKSETLLKNIYFYYTGEVKEFLKMRGRYKQLEDDHEYIQKVFPNHFKSAFNENSFAMDFYEVELFKKYKFIGRYLLQAIQIFLDFLGLELNIHEQIQMKSKDRFNKALMMNYHNFLRIQRMLACLSITGFRHIALSFINFLEKLGKSSPQFDSLRHDIEQLKVYDDSDPQRSLKRCFHPFAQFPKRHYQYEKQSKKIYVTLSKDIKKG